MKEEIAALDRHKTFSELMPLPSGKKAIGLKWLFKTKLGSNGEIIKLKSRIVAKGYAQEYGVDFEETFAPVARFETIRLVLSLAAQSGWLLFQFDVKSAFLNGHIQEEVYVIQPPGFEIEGKEDHVYRLNKALYGLKQSPKAWYSCIDNYFTSKGYQRSNSEPTLYVKIDGKDMIIICLYVDDIVYTSSSDSLLQEFKHHMTTEFEMTDMGELHYFLGLEITQRKDGLFVGQHHYAKNLLDRFGMKDCKPVVLPMNPNEKLTSEVEEEKADATVFRGLVGGLIYLTHTRPDILYSVSLLSRFMCSPSVKHMCAAKRVLRYVARTIKHGIWYDQGKEVILHGFTDSDWGSTFEDCKSISASVFSIGSNAITWSSKKQAIVTLSTTEAEYISASNAACQLIWLRKLLQDVNHEQKNATSLFCDNKSTICLTKNHGQHGRSKHINIKYHHIRELVEQGIISVEYCASEEQLADILTKALPLKQFQHLRASLGVCALQN